MLAHVDSQLADDIDRELRNTATNTEIRRASASAGAALERGGQAQRWAPLLVERAIKEPGVTRGTILGIAGLAIVTPRGADSLVSALVERQPLEAAEAIAELRREEASPLVPEATALAHAWTRTQLLDPNASSDDGRWALLHALDRELGGGEVEGLGVPIAARAPRSMPAMRTPRCATRGSRSRRSPKPPIGSKSYRRRSARSPPLDAPVARSRSRAARRQYVDRGARARPRDRPVRMQF